MLFVLLCLYQLFARAGAYAIGISCRDYSVNGVSRDFTAMITAAMVETNQMMIEAAAQMVDLDDFPSDTQAWLFPGADAAAATRIAGRYHPKFSAICE